MALNPTTEFHFNILNVLNIIGEGIMLYLCYYYAPMMFDFSHTIGLIVDVAQIVAPIVAHLVCLVECLHQKRRMAVIWQNLMRLIDQGGQRLHPFLFERVTVFYLSLAVSTFVLCTTIEVWIMFRATTIWFRSRVVAQWSFMSCRAALLFYILHVTMVGGVIKMLVAELKCAEQASRSQLKSRRVEMEQKNILRNVKFCRKLYETGYRVSLDMSFSFGWTLISQLMYTFMDITIALYYNYRRVTLGFLTAGEER